MFTTSMLRDCVCLSRQLISQQLPQVQFLGHFVDEEEAAHAYDRYVLKQRGPDAVLNFATNRPQVISFGVLHARAPLHKPLYRIVHSHRNFQPHSCLLQSGYQISGFPNVCNNISSNVITAL